MAEPVYRIYYGKYMNEADNEIPVEHIREVSSISFRIEPGKPAEPKTDTVRFTLENFDHTGAERYNDEWFNTQSRSVEEGAIMPFQIYFRIAFPAGVFYGIMKKRKYGNWRETVEIQLENIFEVLSRSEQTILQPITAEINGIGYPQAWGSDYAMTAGVDLEQNNIEHQLVALYEQTELTGDWNEVVNRIENHEYLQHVGLNSVSALGFSEPPTSNEYYEAPPRNAFVQFGDITILTRLSLQVLVDVKSGPEYLFYLMYMTYQPNNGKIEVDAGGDTIEILERGRLVPEYSVNDVSLPQKLTIHDWDQGYGTTALAKVSPLAQSEEPFDEADFLYGCEINIQRDTNDYPVSYDITQSSLSDFDAFEKTLSIIGTALFAQHFNEVFLLTGLFDIDNAINKARRAFYADILQYGWINNSPGEIISSLGMMTNSYIFVAENNRIKFQHRLLHDEYLPTQLPPDAFKIELEDIKPLSGEDESGGFSSYKIGYNDRIEINNVASNLNYNKNVDADGISTEFKLRNSTLNVDFYRTSNLGVPSNNDYPGMPIFRHSPESGSYPASHDLDDFIPDPITQAQNFAKSYTYPVTTWPIEVSMEKYTEAGIGKYFWVHKDGANKVYLIKQIHHKPDEVVVGIQGQYVGDYTP